MRTVEADRRPTDRLRLEVEPRPGRQAWSSPVDGQPSHVWYLQAELEQAGLHRHCFDTNRSSRPAALRPAG